MINVGPEENTLPFIDISVDCNSDGTVHVAWERSTSGLDLDVTNVDIVYACYNGSLSQEVSFEKCLFINTINLWDILNVLQLK